MRRPIPRPAVPRFLLFAALLPLSSTVPLGGCGGAGKGRTANDALVVVRTVSIPHATAGARYDAVIDAAGPHPPLTWLVVGGQLPAGIELDSATGTLSGTPRSAVRARIEIEVRDGLDAAGERDASFASARRAFALVVDPGPLTLLPVDVPPAQYATTFAHRFEAAGGDEPYRFALGGGSLPAGLVLDAEGSLRGVAMSAGDDFRPVVRVTDAAGAVAEFAFALRVVVLPLAIGRAPLPDAARGAPYDARPSSSPEGAGPPYRWSVAPSPAALPPGLVVEASDGRIHGTATTTGTYPFRLEVSDVLGQRAQRDVSLRVNPGPVLSSIDPPTLPHAGGPVTLVGQAFQPGMTAAFGSAAPVAVTYLDATRARVVPPIGPPAAPPQSGAVRVRIENPDGGADERPGAFRYPLAEVSFVAQGVTGGARDHARGLAAGDVDGDGLCDLAHVGSQGIELIRPVGPVYANAWVTKVVRSDGAFNDVRLADVDVDGDLDLVVSRSSTTDTIEVYRNDGRGGFPSTASVVTTYPRPSSFHFPFALATGDVNGDGVPDVACTSGRGNQGTLWIYRGLGDGSFVTVHTAADSIFEAAGGCFGPNSVALADLDGDGRDDVVLTDAFPSACAAGQACPATGAANPHPGGDDFVAWVARSGPDGVPGAWRVVRVSGKHGRLDGDDSGLALYDHDGDGRKDVAVFGGYLNQRGQGIAFLTGDGLGAFTERTTIPTAINRRFGARLDANLDGFDDLIVVGAEGNVAGASGRSLAECWLGGLAETPTRAWATGSEAQAGGTLPGANPGRIVVGDFDGDGLDDFAVDQSFHAKERFPNGQDDGAVEGVAVWLNRSR
jgi:hypothetical protein